MSNGHLLAVDSEAVRKQVARRCPTQLGAYVGATEEQLRLSMLRPVWFTPTIEQSDAGAAWYRCDVIAVSGDQQVAKIDHNIFEALKKPEGRAEFAMCGTAQPGTAAFSRVLCREDHSWKAISVLDLSDQARTASTPACRGQGRRPDRLRRRSSGDRLRRARLRVGLRVADQGPVAGRPDLRQVLVTRPGLTWERSFVGWPMNLSRVRRTVLQPSVRCSLLSPLNGRTITVNSTSLPSSFHCIMSMPWTVSPSSSASNSRTALVSAYHCRL